ncbi:cytochrome P450 [Phlegmacium glaucopus]|nr:cytochrome P450 [Phlegmacium glaucopus]
MTSSDSASHLLFVSLSLAIIPLAGVVFSIYWTYSKWLESPFRGLPYPPGPPAKNIISGNSNDIPLSRHWHTYANWAKIYGDIIHFRIYGQHTIILNSVEDVREMFEQRAGLYSDRPKNVMVDLMGWDFNVNLMAYGDNWRRHRRLCQQIFRPKSSLAYRTIQTQKVHRMLSDLLNRPEHFATHCRTTAAATIMSTMYGHDVSSSTEDDHVKRAEQSVGMLSDALLPGAAIVNAIPALRYLPAWSPGVDFKRLALEAKELNQQLQDAPIAFVKKGIMKGTSGPSVVSDLLETCYMQRDYDVIKGVAATSYTAGIEPTASSITTFFLSMAIYPDAQRKAQDEIDRVIGSNRLPTYDDRKSLPYVEALYREVLRWGPPSPLNTAHTATEDDIYNGYFIPRGATIIANIWAMTRNEDKYPNPDTFMPERFIDEHGNLNDDDMMIVFGFGRRICPGRHMASATIWLSIVSILATLNIRKMKDARGNDIPLDGKYSDRMIRSGAGCLVFFSVESDLMSLYLSYPLPFECSITPRSIITKQLIQDAALRETSPRQRE